MQRIQDRFAARVQEELGAHGHPGGQDASDHDQVVRHPARSRRPAAPVPAGAAGQLRPGVAANQDSVSRLMNRLIDFKIRYAETFKQESGEMAAYLNAVQQAQYFVIRERLLDRIMEAREQRIQSRSPGQGQGVP